MHRKMFLEGSKKESFRIHKDEQNKDSMASVGDDNWNNRQLGYLKLKKSPPLLCEALFWQDDAYSFGGDPGEGWY